VNSIKKYQIPEYDAQILRNALLECEEIILGFGKSHHGYPEDQMVGKMNYYNLFLGVGEFKDHALPYLKEFISDFLQLKCGDKVMMTSWGNVMHGGHLVKRHNHTDKPSEHTVSGNLFLGSDNPTETIYYLEDGEVGIPNKMGEFVLFPPNIEHEVPKYEGNVRVSCAFDAICTTRETRVNSGVAQNSKMWYNYKIT
tara:strand:+ start:777 stop:1367 length:591 start_codon:yes stop_codon:yes gene_type:complete